MRSVKSGGPASPCRHSAYSSAAERLPRRLGVVLRPRAGQFRACLRRSRSAQDVVGRRRAKASRVGGLPVEVDPCRVRRSYSTEPQTACSTLGGAVASCDVGTESHPLALPSGPRVAPPDLRAGAAPARSQEARRRSAARASHVILQGRPNPLSFGLARSFRAVVRRCVRLPRLERRRRPERQRPEMPSPT